MNKLMKRLESLINFCDKRKDKGESYKAAAYILKSLRASLETGIEQIMLELVKEWSVQIANEIENLAEEEECISFEPYILRFYPTIGGTYERGFNSYTDMMQEVKGACKINKLLSYKETDEEVIVTCKCCGEKVCEWLK